MKKIVAMLLALIAVLALMTGCAKEPEEEMVIEEPDWDAILGTETTEETPAEQEEVDNTLVILNQIDDSLRTDYSLMAIDGGNTAGADAFIHWLWTREGLSVADTIGKEQLGDRLFFISHDVTSLYSGEIPAATEQTKVIRLAVTDFVGKSILLDTLLPTFEANYGYTVEVLTAEEDADLLLTHEAEPDTDSARIVDGQESEIIPFLYNHYILCGPASDPAGFYESEDFLQTVASIAQQQLPFVSRGDGSAVHQRELTLWPEERGITAEESSFADYEWYHSEKADMAQCLAKAQELGAHALTDRLSWLEFQQAQ